MPSALRRLAAEPARRPLHVGLAAAVTGLALAPAPPGWAPLAAIATALGLTVARAPGLALAAAALVLLGADLGELRLAQIDRGARLPAGPSARVDAVAELLEHPRPSRFGSSAALRIVDGPARGRKVLARADGDLRWPASADPGLRVRVGGHLRRPRDRAGAGTASGRAFDVRAWLRRRGIGAELELERLAGTGTRRGGALGTIDGMRGRAERALAHGLSPPRAALARGMVLGQDESIAEPVREDFRRSGLAHVLAVSGQNVMLLCALAVPVLALLGVGPRGRVIALLALIAVYVPLAGAGPSLQRAGVMGAAGLLALGAGRPASRVYGLLLAAAVTLALNPLATGDPGWQLSFAAVAGILLLGPGLRRWLRVLPRPLAEGVALTLAATVATGPLLAHHFGAVSLASLPANILALPLVAPVMWLGMVAATVGQLAAGPAQPIAAAVLALLAPVSGTLIGLLAGLAGRFAEAPGAEIPLPLGRPVAVALAYGGILALAGAARRAEPRAEPWLTSGAGLWRLLPRARRRALLALAAAVSLLVGVWSLGPAPAPDRVTVSFLDVGQGDATLIQHPAGGAILFDGGPPEGRVLRRLRAAGVRRLTAVVATHASRDHHGGLVEVLEQIPTQLLLDGGDGTADPAYRAVLAAADRRGTRRVPAAAGQAWRLGGLEVRILSPRPRPPGPAPEDPNPRAVIAVVSAEGLDLLLTADAESPSLLPLRLPDVDAMKVPHHGSKDPGLPAVLARARPDVAVAEVGEGNGYGHPAPATAAAFAAAGARFLRTDRDGTVTLTPGRGGLEVDTER